MSAGPRDAAFDPRIAFAGAGAFGSNQFGGESIKVGFDLSSGSDMTAVAIRRGETIEFLTVSPPCKSWSDRPIDPIADLEAARDLVIGEAVFRPGRFFMPELLWNRVHHLVARKRLSKRQYRRWRGRLKAARRRQEAILRNQRLSGNRGDRIIIDDPWVDGEPTPEQRQAAIDMFKGGTSRE